MDRIAQLKQNLEKLKYITHITHISEAKIKIKFINEFDSLGIPTDVIQKLISLVTIKHNEPDILDILNVFIHNNYGIFILRALDSLNGKLRLAGPILAYIAQNSITYSDWSCLNSMDIALSVKNQILDFLSFCYTMNLPKFTINGTANPLIIDLSEVALTELTDFITRPIVWTVEEWSTYRQKYVASSFALIHASDHYDVPHYHMVSNYNSLKAYYCEAIRRTWIDMILYQQKSLNPGSRINYGYLLLSPTGLKKYEINTLIHLGYANTLNCPYSLLQLRRMDWRDVEKYVMTLPVLPRQMYTYDKIPITDLQLTLMRESGMEPILERVVIIPKDDFIYGIQIDKDDFLLNTYPTGNGINIQNLNTIITSLDATTIRNPGAFNTEIPALIELGNEHVPQVKENITRNDIISMYQGCDDNLRLGFTVKNLLNSYFSNELIVSEKNPLVAQMLNYAVGKNMAGIELQRNDLGEIVITRTIPPLELKTQSIITYDVRAACGLTAILLEYFSKTGISEGKRLMVVVDELFQLSTFYKFWERYISLNMISTNPLTYGTQYTHDGLLGKVSAKITHIIISYMNYDSLNVTYFSRILQELTFSDLVIISFIGIPNVIYYLRAVENRLQELNLPMMFTSATNLTTTLAYPSISLAFAYKDDESIFSDVYDNTSYNAIQLMAQPISNYTYHNDVNSKDDYAINSLNVQPGRTLVARTSEKYFSQLTGIMLGLCTYINVRKVYYGNITDIETYGTTSIKRIALTKRVQQYRELQNLPNSQSLIPGTPRDKYTKKQMSKEEMVTQAGHIMIYEQKLNGNFGGINVDLEDYGSGDLEGIYLTEGNYVAYDISFEDYGVIPGVDLVEGRIDLDQPIPTSVSPKSEILIYNSLFFKETWPNQLNTGAEFAKYIVNFLRPAITLGKSITFTIPIMDESLYHILKHGFRVRREEREANPVDGIELFNYYITLGSYPKARCMPNDFLTALQAELGDGRKLNVYYMTRYDLTRALKIYNLTTTPYDLTWANNLSLVLPVLRL